MLLKCLRYFKHCEKELSNINNDIENTDSKIKDSEIFSILMNTFIDSLHQDWKLMCSFLDRLKSTERGNNVFNAMNSLIEKDYDFFEDTVKKPLHKLSASEARARLMSAIAGNDYRDSLKTLGYLHSKDDNDKDELIYLEALFEFKSQNYAETISLASKVEQSSTDYKKARRITLESLINTGQLDEAINYYDKDLEQTLSPALRTELYCKCLLSDGLTTTNYYQLDKFINSGSSLEISVEDPFNVNFCEFFGSIALELLRMFNEQSYHIDLLISDCETSQSSDDFPLIKMLDSNMVISRLSRILNISSF